MKKIYAHPLVMGLCLVVISLFANILAVSSQETVTPNVTLSTSWNPDGVLLAIAANNGLFIYNRSGQLVHHKLGRSITAIWSSDGARLLVNNQVIDAVTFNILLDSSSTPRGWIDGSRQYFGLHAENVGSDVYDTSIDIFDTVTGILNKKITVPIQIENVISSPDGKNIAVNIGNSIFIIDVNLDTITHFAQAVDGISSYAWSADSTRIVYGASRVVSPGTLGSLLVPDGDLALIYTVNTMDTQSGQVLHTSAPLPSYVSVSWSDDNSQIAGVSLSGEPILYIWDANNVALLSVMSLQGQVTGSVDFNPYGGTVAVGFSNSANIAQPPAAFSQEVTSLGNGAVQIIVPDASPQRLQVIAAACDAPPQVVEAITAVADTQAPNTLSALIEMVEALPEGIIPPGCAADLLAVAEAIQ